MSFVKCLAYRKHSIHCSFVITVFSISSIKLSNGYCNPTNGPVCLFWVKNSLYKPLERIPSAQCMLHYSLRNAISKNFNHNVLCNGMKVPYLCNGHEAVMQYTVKTLRWVPVLPGLLSSVIISVAVYSKWCSRECWEKIRSHVIKGSCIARFSPSESKVITIKLWARMLLFQIHEKEIFKCKRKTKWGYRWGLPEQTEVYISKWYLIYMCLTIAFK